MMNELNIIGVFCMEGAPKHTVTLDVMPLICGYLPLPAVRLSKYIPADQKSKGTPFSQLIAFRSTDDNYFYIQIPAVKLI